MSFVAGCFLFALLLHYETAYTYKFKAHFPPSTVSGHPRLVFSSMPTLNEFTFCSWIRLFDSSDKAPHVFTYAANGTDHDIAVFFRSSESSGCKISFLQVNDNYTGYNCCFTGWNPSSWHHICTSWLGADGSTKFLIDGKRCSADGRGYGTVSSGEHVVGGGIAVLGQDSDGVGSRFDVDQAWNGDVTGVNLWSVVLSDNQIREAGKCDGEKKYGTVIAWFKSPMVAYDGVVIRDSEVCKQ